MNMEPIELEVKYLVSDLVRMEERIQSLGGILTQPRTHEINLRYDTPEGDLTRAHRVLRLRQDQAAILTYKGPAHAEQGVQSRVEIEMIVENFDTARAFLEALGYRVSVMYEKFRTSYMYRDAVITLDEMPYGAFIEIEGQNPDQIHDISDDLRLDWSARAPGSYLEIFEGFKQRRGLTMRDLAFDALEGLNVSPEDMDLHFADR